MKLKLCILTLVGLVGWSFAAVAQITPPTGELQSTNTSVTTNDNGEEPLADADVQATDPGASTNAPPAETQDTAPQDLATNEVVDTTAGSADPATDAVDSAAADATDLVADAADAEAAPETLLASATLMETNAMSAAGGTIPLIVMDDVPLTDAIKNLARQANLNYILDPKVSFGQVGPDGKPVPQPSVSIRWENVTASQALSALLGTYNLQLVEDPKSKIAKVTVKDPAAPDPLVTKVIQLKYASPTNIMVAIQNTFTDKRSKVVGDVRTSQLVLLATEKELADVDQLIERLDTKTKQVLIEAKLLETSVSPSTTKGIDWSGTLQEQHVTFGNVQPFSSLINMSPSSGSFFSPSTFFLDADGVAATLSFLNKYAEAKVLSAPRTVTLDNETAKIEVTRASPIITITPGTVQVAGGSSIQYTNLGVILNVTPRISADNYVNLKVIPEVSRVFDTVKRLVSVGDSSGVYEADEYDIRKLETRVMIPSGNTLVLGGMVQDDIRNGNTKVPVLGDIPGIGLLFRNDTKSRQKSNLLVFLTPTIVQDEDYQPTTTEFLRTPVPMKDSIEPDWGAWNSGKPRDWSKPENAESTKFSAVPDTSVE